MSFIWLSVLWSNNLEWVCFWGRKRNSVTWVQVTNVSATACINAAVKTHKRLKCGLSVNYSGQLLLTISTSFVLLWLMCLQKREWSALWYKCDKSVGCPWVWTIYQNIFLSYSCSVNLVSSVSESSSGNKIKLDKMMVCICWLVNYGLSLKSQWHAN